MATVTEEEVNELSEQIRLIKIKLIKKYGWQVARHWTDLEEV